MQGIGNPQEQERIKDFRKVINTLINNLPENVFACPEPNCGRKFNNAEDLKGHIERRHPKHS